MIRHSAIKAVIHHSICDVNAPGEDLVQMSSHLMGCCVSVISGSEIEEVHFAIHVVDVIVKVTAHDDRGICILLNDILDDQYQLNHATLRNCLGAFCHYVIDSSLASL